MSEPTSIRAYANGREHLLDELARIDLLLRRHLEARWAEPDPRSDQVPGLFVSDEEVDRLLHDDQEAAARIHADEPRKDDHPAGQSAAGLEAVTQSIRERVADSLEAGVDLRLVSLVATFGLSAREVDVLLLALAPDIDPKYEKVYGYLRDDVTRSRPTVDVLLRVLTHSESERLALMDVFAARSPLIDEDLVRIETGATIPSSPVRIEERVVEYLLGSDAVDDALVAAAEVIAPEAGVTQSLLNADRRDTIEQIAGRLVDPAAVPIPGWITGHPEDSPDRRTNRTAAAPPRQGRPLFVAGVGPPARTAEIAAAVACERAGVRLLRVDGDALAAGEIDFETVRREAWLQAAAIHVTSADAFDTPDRGQSDDGTDRPATDDRFDQLFAGLDGFPGDVFVTGDAAITPAAQSRLEGHRLVHLAFPRPDYAQRKAIWEAVDDRPADADPATLAGSYRLDRGGIEDAVETARSMTDGPLTVRSLREACRLHSRRALDDLATEIDPTYEWDDIVLPADTLDHLREIAGAIRHRGTVFEEWGFADRYSLGNGINLLFTGKSGTGKTMAADIVAGEVGLPLYKLDLSRIVSKYIGETEKNLGRVFDAAEASNAILFFDEADALFGKRTEISDSHDRYANVEVDYLLQRMEEHDGCVIMASNLKENIDDAFQRRINATVAFPMPDEQARREIWRSIFPAGTPTGDIDYPFLAGFELSGGFIKNVALTAAFMAAEDDEDVRMDHLVRALRREFQKTGKLYGLDAFGEYRDVLD